MHVGHRSINYGPILRSGEGIRYSTSTKYTLYLLMTSKLLLCLRREIVVSCVHVMLFKCTFVELFVSVFVILELILAS